MALTFDDGFRDFYTAAWPVLREFGFTATMFLPTGFVGEGGPKIEDRRLKIEEAGQKIEDGRSKIEVPSSELRAPSSELRRSLHGRECLTWGEVRELRQAGMEFGSHTVNHPKLVELSWPEIERELRDSKAELERQLGEPATTFAYPYAFPENRHDFVDRFRDLLKSSGYETNVTTQIGRHRLGDDVLQIKRLPVNSLDDTALLEAKVAGGYDWLARPQGLIKRLKRGNRR